jgi:hypothetical protein
VDLLLKKEFDLHRAAGSAHPLMSAYGIEAIPLAHELMNEWRDAKHAGIKYLHSPTNFLVTGGVDDVWVNPEGEYIIVDYKATAKSGEVSLDADWQIGYKRQMEVYQWLFRRNGYKVSETGYFVYCNGITDKEAFDGKLEFEVKVIPYLGKTDWVEKTLFDIHQTLLNDQLPPMAEGCTYCRYVQAASEVLQPVTF